MDPLNINFKSILLRFLVGTTTTGPNNIFFKYYFNILLCVLARNRSNMFWSNGQNISKKFCWNHIVAVFGRNRSNMVILYFSFSFYVIDCCVWVKSQQYQYSNKQLFYECLIVNIFSCTFTNKNYKNW